MQAKSWISRFRAGAVKSYWGTDSDSITAKHGTIFCGESLSSTWLSLALHITSKWHALSLGKNESFLKNWDFNNMWRKDEITFWGRGWQRGRGEGEGWGREKEVESRRDKREGCVCPQREHLILCFSVSWPEWLWEFKENIKSFKCPLLLFFLPFLSLVETERCRHPEYLSAFQGSLSLGLWYPVKQSGHSHYYVFSNTQQLKEAIELFGRE